MVTIIGSVRTPAEVLLDLTDLRHFTLETSVYDASKAAPVQFEVTCFLENTKRWQKVKTPPSGSFLSITAKVVGRITQTSHLAVRVLDLTYLPRPGSATGAATPATTPSKRPGRWDGRAVSTTPSKKPRMEPDEDTRAFSDPTPAPELLRTTSPALEMGVDKPRADTESSVHCSPSSATADPDASPLSSIPSLTSDNGTRALRNRQPPRKYSVLE